MRKSLQFDIGFGDVVVPKPEALEYPTLLEMDPPVIMAYSKESIIAEKFEAMIYLAEINSRMKDFINNREKAIQWGAFKRRTLGGSDLEFSEVVHYMS